MSLSLESKITISLHKIGQLIEADNKKEALLAVSRLREAVSRIGRNNEAIFCAYLHTDKTLKESRDENSLILTSRVPLHKLILKN